MKWVLVSAYGGLLMGCYIVVAVLCKDSIMYDGKSYYSLLHPLVCIAQLLSLFLILLYCHFLNTVILHPIFWFALPPFYSKINPYTGIPTLL